ncbi:carbohydrate kinase family protein [Mucilaginibacter aquatilis]|uniref:Carbohydrate kinase n=1 Tax=Mucilaginibacter aquatilis TaxID=1517760 RepID=A0A6I4I5L5_9SPHI|nr:carbohydrate kinase [Mucilaginibacter aquatilis]MVN90371.1 carbohydrate kinase [Mucilaginibacter aquatilis]
MNKQVLCFGEVLWDTFDDGKKVGGAPLNVARHLLQQNANATMVSRIGTDEAGNELLSVLTENGLDISLIQSDKNLPTCEVAVQLNDEGHATYIIPQPVSWDNIQPTDEFTEQIEKAEAIVFGSLACRQAETRNTLLNMLSEYTVPLRVFDVNLRPPHFEQDTIETLAALSNVIKMNEDEANMLIHGSAPLREKMIEFHKKFHTQTICVTRGENGALIWHDEEFYEHPGFKVDVVDTVGAGDSFLATLVAGLINNQPMPDILEKACKIGGFVASQRGANPTYTTELL